MLRAKVICIDSHLLETLLEPIIKSYRRELHKR